jgi:hypothetical protein
MISCDIFSGMDMSNVSASNMNDAFNDVLDNIAEFIDDPACESL